MRTPNKKHLDQGFWIGLFLIGMLVICTETCTAQTTKHVAQIDTMACHPECIQKYVQQPTNNGNVRIYAVYNDKQNSVSDLIPVSKSVYEYILMCKENGIKPSLGIRLRDGRITSIIKLKTIYRRKK